MILMTAAILVSINPWLALVTLVPLPFIAWLIQFVRNRLRHGFDQVYRIWSEVTSVLADTIPGIRVVKAFAQEKREAAALPRSQRPQPRRQRPRQQGLVVLHPHRHLSNRDRPAGGLGLRHLAGFGTTRSSVGVLMAFLAYTGRFYSRLGSMSRIVPVTQKAAAGAKRIFDILDHVSSVPEPAHPVHLGHVSGAIELRDVSFRYGTRTILRTST